MAKRIQGITIELDGDSKPLKKALQDVDKASSNTTKELGQINRALKFDEGNTTLLAQKFEVLQDAISNTSTRLDTLKRAQSEVDRQFKAGEIDTSTYREFQREIEITEGKLKAFKKQADTVKSKINVQADSSGIDKMKSKLKELGPAAKQAGKEIADGIKAGAAGATAALGGIAIGTQELNTDLARLKTNATLAGRDMGLVEEAFMRVASVSGETDSAVETLSNLLASGFSDQQLSKVIDEVNGAAIKFSDTLKTEGIADGIQETFATGKAVGQFGELLERSGINLDEFNEKLAETKSEGEKSNLILQTMSDLGLSKVTEKYNELNPAISESNAANVELQKSLADLGVAITPIITAITLVITQLTTWMAQNPELANTLLMVGAAITTIAGALTVLGPIISSVSALLGPLLGIFTGTGAAAASTGAATAGFGASLSALLGPIGLVVAAIAGIIVIFVTFKDDILAIWNEHLKPLFDEFVKMIVDTLQPAFEAGFKAISDIVKGAFEVIKNLWTSILHPVLIFIINFIRENLMPVFKVVFSTIGSVVSNAFNLIGQIWNGTLKPILNGIIDFVSGVFTGNWEKVWNGISSIFSGVFNGLINIAKAPINAIISMINGVIDGLNSIQVPDWVPAIGGMGINLPKIPMLAKGTNYFKGGLAIVGEKGPELVQMPTGSKVYSNDKTKQMLGAQQGPQIIVVQSVLDGRVIGESVVDVVSGKQYSNANLRALTNGVSL
ncbi:phage tail tape measure protein [Lysinibacillus sp. PLM2]|nr:phage tail tape measure protein [Lysinibacillus sp. PLM2]